MAPTMQVARKAFIVPTPAAQSPKERYAHTSFATLDVFSEACLKGRDRQGWNASHLSELLPECDTLVADITFGCPILILD
jgi:hypothetical protein